MDILLYHTQLCDTHTLFCSTLSSTLLYSAQLCSSLVYSAQLSFHGPVGLCRMWVGYFILYILYEDGKRERTGQLTLSLYSLLLSLCLFHSFFLLSSSLPLQSSSISSIPISISAFFVPLNIQSPAVYSSSILRLDGVWRGLLFTVRTFYMISWYT